MLIARRGFLLGLVATPAVVSASNLMPIRPWEAPIEHWGLSPWLLCNGAKLSPAEWPELFAVLGYSHGRKGDHFRLPNHTPEPREGFINATMLATKLDGIGLPVGGITNTASWPNVDKLGWKNSYCRELSEFV